MLREMTSLLALALLPSPPAARAASASDVALGDAAYARFDNGSALRHYQTAALAFPDDAEARWRLARAHADVGQALEATDQDAAREHYRRGEGEARKAVELDPRSANAHFFLAVCLGRMALFEGGKTKIRLSREVRTEAERAILLDTGHDGAYYVLGRWNYGIATLSWILKAFAKVIYGGVPEGATVEKAAEMFEKAIELDPARPMHHLEYARALAKLGRYSEARVHLQQCLDLPQVQWDDPIQKAEAARMLKDLRGEKDEIERP